MTTRLGYRRENFTVVSNWLAASLASVPNPRCSTRLTWIAFACSPSGADLPSEAAYSHIFASPVEMEPTGTSIPGIASKMADIDGRAPSQGFRQTWPCLARSLSAPAGPQEPAG
jgi:hypothetical protein